MKQRKLNAAQHIWLAIMTELALERCAYSRVLIDQYKKHCTAGGYELRPVQWVQDYLLPQMQ